MTASRAASTALDTPLLNVGFTVGSNCFIQRANVPLILLCGTVGGFFTIANCSTHYRDIAPQHFGASRGPSVLKAYERRILQN